MGGLRARERLSRLAERAQGCRAPDELPLK